MLEVRLLGKFEVRLSGEVVSISSRAEQSLLAYLILNAGTAFRREHLAGLFWPDSDETNARAYLRRALWRLRKAFAECAPGAPDYFLADRITLAFNPQSEYWLDAAVLEEERGEELDDLLAATQVYVNELLPGFYDEWVINERERLRALFAHKMQRLLKQLQSARRWEEMLQQAERWIALGGIPEPAYRALILGNATQGDIASGLAAYDRLAMALEQELGVEPSRETTLLVEQIHSGKPVAPAGAARDGKPLHNLPIEPTHFVGRVNELEKIAALLANPTCRLLTLVGPGGSGKSRIALKTAENQIGSYRNGVFFISLAGIDSSELLPSVIVTALGHESSGQSDPKEQLFNYLLNKEMLLVLDNFEQLRSGINFLSEMLQQARNIKLLITSRERLNLQSEWVFPIEGLQFPHSAGVNQIEGCSAVTLFIQTAKHVYPNFVLNERNKSCVAQICMSVEGMPLAIELAAAWTRVLSCREISEEIECGLDFLRVNQPDLPKRHRSVRATFEHSWRLLSQEERAVFRRLSVFRGGFERQSARQVAGASLGTLAALVDKSLVQRHPDGRYRIHELLRQFAAGELEKSGETEATREQHLAYFLQLARQAEPNLWRDQEKLWLDRLDSELDNLRQALKWSLSPQSRLGIRAGLGIVIALEYFIYKRGHFKKAAEWLADLLAHPQAAEQPKIMANGLRFAAYLNWWIFGKHEKARHQFERSLEIAEEQGDPLTLANILCSYGHFCDQVDHDLPLAEAYLERSLLLFRQSGNEPGIATALRRLGIVSYFKAEPLKACSYTQESLQIFRALGNNSGIALALFCLGWGEAQPGRFEEARSYLEECLAIHLEINKILGQVNVPIELGRLEFACGNIAKAKAYFEHALAEAREFGMKRDQPEAMISLGGLAFFQEDYSKALSYYQEALVMALEQENNSNQSRAQSAIGILYLRQGDEGRAYQCLKKGLLLGKDLRLWEWVPALIGMAGLSAARGELQRAARLLGTADGVLELTLTSPRYYPSVYPDYERIKAQLRGQLNEDTFSRLVDKGRALAAEGMDRIIEFALGKG